MNRIVRRVITVVVAAAVVCGGVYGGLSVYKRSSATAVNVYPVEQVSYLYDDFGSEGGSYGTVSLDGIQNVYVSSPTTVKKVNVVQGDSVKKGDVLVTYDTTQLEIEVAKAENDLAQKQLNLKLAKEDLEIANRLSPSSSNADGGGADTDDGGAGDDGVPSDTDSSGDDSDLSAEDTPIRLSGSGTSEDPYIYLWSTGDALTDEVLLHMFQPDGYDENTGTVTSSFIMQNASSEWFGSLLKYMGFFPVTVYGSEGEEPDPEEPDTAAEVEEGQEETSDTEASETNAEDNTNTDTGTTTSSADVENGTTDNTTDSSAASTYDETGSTGGVNLTGCPNEVYVILEVHESDNREGTLVRRYGMHLIRVGQDVAAKLYDPDASSDSTTDSSAGTAADTADTTDGGDTGDAGDDSADEGDLDDGEEGAAGPATGSAGSDSSDGTTSERVDPNGSYTAEEIADLKKSKTKEVRDLTIDVRQAEITLKQQKKAAEDGTAKAQFDGVVVFAEEAQIAYENGEPCVKVSAGGGYRISIAVGELEVQDLSVGDEVTVKSAESDWYAEDEEEGSEAYAGTIRSISPYPTSGSGSEYYLYSSETNPNSSAYPCVVYVDGEDAMLNEYELVTVQFDSSESETVLYLDRAFVRTDTGGSYVYREGKDGKLVKTYIEIKGGDDWSVGVAGGLDSEDYVAFPYGTDVTEGAAVSEQEDTDTLYA